MEIYEFENITIDLDINIAAFKYLLDSFEYRVTEEYNLDNQIYKDLRSNIFLFNQIYDSLRSVRDNYQEKIELCYKNKEFTL